MGPRRNSIVWHHFAFVGDTEVQCTHCFKIIKYTQSTSTHNLIRHLQAKHSKEFKRRTNAPAPLVDTAETEIDQSEMIMPEVIITQEQIKQILQSSPPSTVAKKEPDMTVMTNGMETSKNFVVQEESEFDAFGRNVVLQLKALPLKEALEAEELILGILRRQRIRVLDRR